jgi:murein L,D-transpeptidase YafK
MTGHAGRRLPGLLLTLLCLVPALLRGETPVMADRLVVYKSERRLDLLHQGQVIRSFRVALGLSPAGPKRQEGDFRTPEGEYRITHRNPASDYFLSLGVSYPGPEDRRRASAAGVRPGGNIMIHGLPNRPSRPLRYYQTRDWTNGCIAVANAEMVDIWLLTPDNTPITILP